jgi:hypothetical protein
MLRRYRIDHAEPNTHPTLGSGHTKRAARRRVDAQGLEPQS